MQPAALLTHAAQLFALAWRSPQPADRLAAEYLRGRRSLSAVERRSVSESVFSALRKKTLAEHCAGPVRPPDAPVGIVSAALLLDGADPTPALSDLLGDEIAAAGWIEAARERFAELDRAAAGLLEKSCLTADEVETLATRYAAPAWLLSRWKESRWHGRSWREVARLAESLLSSAPVGLRVNRNLASRDQALAEFRRHGIEARPGTLSPDALLLTERVDLTPVELFRRGGLEVQDEGSQLVGLAVAPAPGGRVLDACAGAGGKSLHLAALQGGRGEVVGTDVALARLKELSRRARRAGFGSIETYLVAPGRPSPLAGREGTFDAVLVDAPCSGLGTARRLPMAKWRAAPERLAKLAATQLRLLTSNAAFVRPGGVLVYSTCSLAPDENEAVAEAFLADHPDFAPDPLAPAFAEYSVRVPALSPDASTLTLTPSEHGTDGFFIARFRRDG